jgi:hypothetical protein
MKFILLFICGFIFTQNVFAHARLVIPAPRDLNVGNKVGPCGSTPKPAVATTTYVSGSTIPIQITEVIDHPGKYLLYLSTANDTNFLPYQFPIVPDIQGGTLPHTYNVNITLPSITCDNCTLQMMQSMEEDPANPSYYYSCADIKLTSAGAPNPGGIGANGGTGAQNLRPTTWPGFGGGCASLSNRSGMGGGPSGGSSGAILFILMLPLCFLRALRKLKPSFGN